MYLATAGETAGHARWGCSQGRHIATICTVAKTPFEHWSDFRPRTGCLSGAGPLDSTFDSSLSVVDFCGTERCQSRAVRTARPFLRPLVSTAVCTCALVDRFLSRDIVEDLRYPEGKPQGGRSCHSPGRFPAWC